MKDLHKYDGKQTHDSQYTVFQSHPFDSMRVNQLPTSCRSWFPLESIRKLPTWIFFFGSTWLISQFTSSINAKHAKIKQKMLTKFLIACLIKSNYSKWVPVSHMDRNCFVHPNVHSSRPQYFHMGLVLSANKRDAVTAMAIIIPIWKVLVLLCYINVLRK